MMNEINCMSNSGDFYHKSLMFIQWTSLFWQKWTIAHFSPSSQQVILKSKTDKNYDLRSTNSCTNWCNAVLALCHVTHRMRLACFGGQFETFWPIITPNWPNQLSWNRFFVLKIPFRILVGLCDGVGLRDATILLFLCSISTFTPSTPNR